MIFVGVNQYYHQISFYYIEFVLVDDENATFISIFLLIFRHYYEQFLLKGYFLLFFYVQT